MNVQRGVQMIIKQPNGKYCEMNHEGECLGFNYTKEDVIDRYIDNAQKQARKDIKNAEHFVEIIKANECKLKPLINNKILKQMGFTKPYEELVKFVPRKPLNISYSSCDFTTYGLCPSCHKTVYDSIGGIIEKCNCGQLLKWN